LVAFWTLLLLLLAPGILSAQFEAIDGVYYTRDNEFTIPFNTDPRGRPIDQVVLFVSDDFGRTYAQMNAVAPEKHNFVVTNVREGHHWYAVQTHYSGGQVIPRTADLTPGLKVCVDRTRPVITLRPGVVSGFPAGVEWEVSEDNPNLAGVRLDYRASGDRDWHPINVPAPTVNSLKRGQQGWAPQVTGPLEVRMSVRDLAGNEGEASTTVQPDPNWKGGSPLPGNSQPGRVIMVNKRKIQLNYKLDNVGKSNVSKVEVWFTQDTRTWQWYADAPANPPYSIELNSEGRYGFTLVAVSGVGLSIERPRAGDPPQVWIEVDETIPDVRLTSVEVGQGVNAGKMTIRWAASDRYLKAQPITLSYGSSESGPWTPIKTNLANEGVYVWSMPSDGLPFEFFVRVEAADEAGNVGSAQTPRKVAVDLSIPKASVIGVEPAPQK
jgi:hypothetical protein